MIEAGESLPVRAGLTSGTKWFSSDSSAADQNRRSAGSRATTRALQAKTACAEEVNVRPTDDASVGAPEMEPVLP